MAAARQLLPLLGPTQEARSLLVNAQRTINLLPVIEKPGAKGLIALYPTPGLTITGTPASGACRSNGVKFGDYTYKVIGNSLVRIDTSGNGTAVGTLSTSGGRVSMARGRSYLMIVDGTAGYTWDGTTLATIASADFPNGATHCDYLDTYFIVNKPDTDEYYISGIEDPTTWSAADYGRAQSSPDDVLALGVNSKNLYLFGDDTTEVHFNSQNADFPFEPYTDGVIDLGIAAAHSLVKARGLGLLLLGTTSDGDAQVVRLSGLQYVPIADDDVHYTINEFATVSDAFGMAWRQHGHTYYALTFPSADRTFVFDLTTGLTHERKSDAIGRWRVGGIAKVGPTTFVAGDYANGNLYTLDEGVYTENGATLERRRVTQVVHAEGRRLQFHRVILDVAAGVGLVTGQGSDPQAMMRYSDDGGKTWSHELWKSLGQIGEYDHRVEWDNLGESRNRIFEFTVTDPVLTVFAGAYADIEVLKD